MESAADWPPPDTPVTRKSQVAQFCAAQWPDFTPALTPHMNVSQHVLFPLARRGHEDKAALADAALSAVGLRDLGGRFPHELSGGQQQRVAVARAIVGGPAVLLMDEPLSNLDVQLRLQLRDELKAAHLKAGATSVFVTHDQSEAFALSDHIIIMHNGSIIQDGPPADLRTRPRTRAVAEFLGVENIITARDLREAAQGLSEDAKPDSTLAFAAAALTTREPDHPANWVRLGGCLQLESTFDGTVHTSRIRCGALELVAKALARPVVVGPDAALWLHTDDLIRIDND